MLMRRGWLALAWMIVGTASLVAADEAYPSPAQVRPLLIGSEVPSALVVALDGTEVDLRKLVGDDPTLVIFFRGGW